MAPRRPAGEDRRPGRLHGDDADRRLAPLEDFADSRDRAPRTHRGHEHIDGSSRVGPDLLGGGPPVDPGVRRVAELVEGERIGDLADKLGGPRNGVAHEDARGEHDLRAEVAEQRTRSPDIDSGIARTSR